MLLYGPSRGSQELEYNVFWVFRSGQHSRCFMWFRVDRAVLEIVSCGMFLRILKDL